MSTRVSSKTSIGNRVTRGLLIVVVLMLAQANRVYLASQQPATPGTAGAIIGMIQDERGTPLENAKVTLSSGDLITSKSTQADGKFEFHNLRAAQYRVTVEAARFRRESVTLTLRPDETFALPTVKLIPSSLHVAVLDSGNQPLSGVTVSLYAKERATVGALAARSVTDEYGDAYFGKLAPGSFQLSATLRGYDEYRNDVFISSGITTEFPLQLLVAPVIPMNEKAVSRYTVPNLPAKNVQAVFQDSDGWMWFGTDKGLARFNGAEFKSSAIAGSTLEQFSGEDVRSIAEDKTGMIWLATSHGVRRITKSGEDGGPLLWVREPRAIVVDSTGNVWVSGSEGVARFDGRVFVPLSGSAEVPPDEVRGLAEDKSGGLWIATANGLSVLEGQKLSSLQHWRESRGVRQQSYEPGNLSDVRTLFIDTSNRIWLATAGDLYLIDNGRILRPSIGAVTAAKSAIRAISEDLGGRMWFALEAGGVIVYDPAKRESQRVNFLDRDKVGAIIAGRDGNLWFATDNGVISSDFYSFVSFTTSRGLADNDVQQIVVAPEGSGLRGRGSLWFLTLGGVSRLEGERIIPVEGFRSGISVQGVAFDKTGAAWFATDQGGLRWTGDSLTQFNEGSGLASNNVQWVNAIAGGSAIVFATTRGASVFREGSLRSIDALAGNDVRHVFEDGDGSLWFSTGRGVVNVDQNGKTDLIDISRGLADNDVRWITRFNDKLLFATRAGIQSYNRGSTFSTIDPEPTNTMFVDRDGYLWSGTDEGQVKKFLEFAGHMLSSVYSGEAHALTGNRVNAISQDKEGRIWIATNKGAVRHIPVEVAPAAQITLEVDGHAQSLTDNGSYYVSYGRHRLTFRFSAACTSGQARYIYRINSSAGEQPWDSLPVQQGAERDVSRMDLDEGTHTFELIALNRDLYGSKTPAAAISVRVGVPFWKSWWFYTLTIALIALALGAAVAVRRFGDREYVLPKELRAFVPIEPNPFIVGNPIRTEKMFYGREDDFRYVRTKLEGTSQGVVIVFCGERRAGKSSILYQVAGGRLGERFIPVFVDLQEMVIASDSEFFARISRLIAESVTKANGTLAEAASARDAMPAAEAVALAGSVPAGAAGKTALAQSVSCVSGFPG